MVVKSKIGRKRYVVVQINSSQAVSKRDLIHTINKMIYVRPFNENYKNENNYDQDIREDWQFKTAPWVILIKDNIGLIRCHHLDKEKTINLLQSIQWIGRIDNNVKIRTLGTTGTIRSARKKYLDKLILYPLSKV